ncbi:TBC-domain-containing protein [Backusella circina FSU 941]|nr:TBC-domain-containing protein [Backusella circina FSU 941]
MEAVHNTARDSFVKTSLDSSSVVDTFVNENKHTSLEEISRFLTFSEDDDSTFSTDEDDDDRLLTPPLLDMDINTQVDWEFWSDVIANPSSVLKKKKKRKELLLQIQRQGIPDAIRGTVWPMLNESKGYYEKAGLAYIQLLNTSSVYEKAITRDLHRTFPYHPYFQSELGQESLFNVMKAYSLYDDQLGYCQGLAFIAGPLLLNMPEEEAFCMLVQLLQQYGLRDHYTPQMNLLRQRLYQFDGLLHDMLPHIYRHLNEQGVKSNMYVSQWFLTLFAYKFPLKVVFRIYDILFVKGVDCLFQIGLALLKKNQSTLLALEFEALVDFLKDDMLAIYNDDITDLLEESYTIEIPPKTMDKLAKEYHIVSAKADTEAELLESLRQRNKALSQELSATQQENEALSNDYHQMMTELGDTKTELDVVYDRNDTLRQQNREIKKVLELIPQELERQAKEQLRSLIDEQHTLTQTNIKLQERLADMEMKLIEMKLMYAQSESDRESLGQTLSDLKRWMNTHV